MECVLFVGLQGSGKTSFFKERFFGTHVHVSLDVLRTRHREAAMLNLCLQSGQRFVIDNTNPTRVDRLRYIDLAKTADFRVIGFYFRSQLSECLPRNRNRQNSIPEAGVLSTAKRLEQPQWREGFDELNYVWLEQDRFSVEQWKDEV